MNSIRCFIAIKVDPIKQYFDYITNIESEFNVRIKVVKPENYHFTLHFFGDISVEEIDKVDEFLETIELQKFEYILSKTGSIPHNKLRRTRVLYVDPSVGRDYIIKTTNTIRELLILQGIQVQKRQYLPHLTICRVKSGNEIEGFTRSWLNKEFEDMNIQCNGLELIKSDLTPRGPIYTTMYDYKLN